MAVLMMKTASNRQLEEQKMAREAAFESGQNMPIITGLSGHVKRAWQSARNAKMPIERQLLNNLRQRKGEYEPDQLSLIKLQGGSEIFMMITSSMCRSAEAWVSDIMLPKTNDRPFSCDPSEIPSLPPNVQSAITNQLFMQAQQAGWTPDQLSMNTELLHKLALQRIRDIAQETADGMKAQIADRMTEGSWDVAFKEFLYYWATFKSAFIKWKPVNKKSLQWAPAQSGQFIPQVKRGIKLAFEARSPFDIYPSPTMRRIQQGYLIDRYMLSRQDLVDLKGVPGYNEEAINKCLDLYGAAGIRQWLWGDITRSDLENRHFERYEREQDLEALNFWGSASGNMMNQWSESLAYDPGEEYPVEVWALGQYVIKAMVNSDPLGRKPYAMTSFEKVPGSFWGDALPEVVHDSQGMCNGAARSLQNNMSMASGPQVEVNIDRLPPGEKVTQIYPWKVTQTLSDMTGNNQPAVKYTDVASHAQELMQVYDHFHAIAQNESGIPAYEQGDTHVGGAGRTASGLSMLMGNAGRGMQRHVGNIDIDIIEPVVEQIYDFEMMHNPDPAIKGDMNIKATGVRILMQQQEMQVRRTELLQATNNPLDAQIMGVGGRKELLTETIKGAGLPVDKIIPSELEVQLAAASAPPVHELAGAKPGIAGSGQSPPGGSPAAPETTLPGGAPAGAGPSTPAMRDGGLANNAGGALTPVHEYVDGGEVKKPEPKPTRWKFQKEHDGSITAEAF